MSLPSLKQSQVEPEFRWRDSNQRIRLRAGAWCAFAPRLSGPDERNRIAASMIRQWIAGLPVADACEHST